MTQFPLDIATDLVRLEDNRFRSDAGGSYWNFQSAFGGWALALAYSAIQEATPQEGALASVTASFLKPLPQDGLIVDVRSLREGRRTNFYRTEFFADTDATEPTFVADLVFSDLRDKPLDYSAKFPTVKAPEDSDRIPDSPGPRFLSKYEQRMCLGKAFSKQDQPHSAVWVRDASERPWDAKGLLTASDTPMPRTFFLDPSPRFGATVQYDLHVHCTPADLAEQGSDFVLVEANADLVGRGRFSQTTRIWSRSGKLLAISNQLAFY